MSFMYGIYYFALPYFICVTMSCRIPSTDLEAQAAAAKEIVQYCILPRLFLSPKDAMYCVEFLRQIHKLGPPNLRLLSVVDRLFKELGFMVRCCTPRESTNLGIFFADLMSLVSMWRDKATFEQQCLNAEAFKSYKSGELQPVSHDEFIRLSANWHKRLTLDVFKSCIVSEDYMQMKNVLLVLNRMVRIYPATKEDAEELRVTLKPISENDPREDLKTLARMYCTGLEMSVRDRQMVDSRQEYAGLPPPVRKKQPQVKESKQEEENSSKKKESSTSKKESKREEKKEEAREDRRGSRHRSSESSGKRHRNQSKHEERDSQEPMKDTSRSNNKKRKTDDREVSRSERSGRGSHEGKREKDSRNGKQQKESASDVKREAPRTSGKHSDRKDGHSREETRRQTRDKPKLEEKRSSRNPHSSRQEPRGESRAQQQGSSRDKKRSRQDDAQPARDQSKRSRSDRRQPKPSGESKKRHQDSREFKKEPAEPKRERSDRRERTRR